jgi:hypothetical protein
MAMNRIKALLFFIAVSGMPVTASASIIFDIFAVSDSQNLGFIEFASDGVLNQTTDVLDFNYTQKFDGISFDESHLTALNVLVDQDAGQLCWGDWSLGLTNINPLADCGRQTDPTEFAPYGLTGLNGVNFVGFWAGGKTVYPNLASDAGDDDEDLYFLMRQVPESPAHLLFLAGLLGLVAARSGSRRTPLNYVG